MVFAEKYKTLLVSTLFLANMDHVAILNKKLPWLERIKSGEKTVESRWYQHKKAPWNNIAIGDRVFFKNSGKLVTLMASVCHVKFYEELNPYTAEGLVKKHAVYLGIRAHEVEAFLSSVARKRFCILITLSEVIEIDPFAISKKGFGSMSAWITVADINQIKL